MNIANQLTFFRITLAPVFFVIYLLPNFFPSWFANGTAWTIPVLWIIFIISEVTDFLDGFAARKLNLTSDFGKLFDPFADTLMQITCFLCFIIDGIYPAGILPAILLLIVIYREFSILFVRNLMLKKGVTMGARMPGKIKTVTYIIAVGAALLAASIQRLEMFEFIFPYVQAGALVIFIISVIFSVISFFDYLAIYRKTDEKKEAA